MKFRGQSAINILGTCCFVVVVVVCKSTVVFELLGAMSRTVVRVDRRVKYPINVNKANKIILIKVEQFVPSSFVTFFSIGTAAKSSFRRM